MTRTGRLNKSRVVLSRQEGVGEVTEELLQQPGHAVHVVEEVLGIAEVEVARAGICTTD